MDESVLRARHRAGGMNAPLTSPTYGAYGAGDDDEEEEIPELATRAGGRLVVTESMLEAEMATLRGLGLYARVAITPATPASSRRKSLPAARAESEDEESIRSGSRGAVAEFLAESDASPRDVPSRAVDEEPLEADAARVETDGVPTSVADAQPPPSDPRTPSGDSVRARERSQAPRRSSRLRRNVPLATAETPSAAPPTPSAAAPALSAAQDAPVDEQEPRSPQVARARTPHAGDEDLVPRRSPRRRGGERDADVSRPFETEGDAPEVPLDEVQSGAVEEASLDEVPASQADDGELRPVAARRSSRLRRSEPTTPERRQSPLELMSTVAEAQIPAQIPQFAAPPREPATSTLDVHTPRADQHPTAPRRSSRLRRVEPADDQTHQTPLEIMSSVAEAQKPLDETPRPTSRGAVEERTPQMDEEEELAAPRRSSRLRRVPQSPVAESNDAVVELARNAPPASLDAVPSGEAQRTDTESTAVEVRTPHAGEGEPQASPRRSSRLRRLPDQGVADNDDSTLELPISDVPTVLEDGAGGAQPTLDEEHREPENGAEAHTPQADDEEQPLPPRRSSRLRRVGQRGEMSEEPRRRSKKARHATVASTPPPALTTARTTIPAVVLNALPPPSTPQSPNQMLSSQGTGTELRDALQPTSMTQPSSLVSSTGATIGTEQEDEALADAEAAAFSAAAEARSPPNQDNLLLFASAVVRSSEPLPVIEEAVAVASNAASDAGQAARSATSARRHVRQGLAESAEVVALQASLASQGALRAAADAAKLTMERAADRAIDVAVCAGNSVRETVADATRDLDANRRQMATIAVDHAMRAASEAHAASRAAVKAILDATWRVATSRVLDQAILAAAQARTWAHSTVQTAGFSAEVAGYELLLHERSLTDLLSPRKRLTRADAAEATADFAVANARLCAEASKALVQCASAAVEEVVRRLETVSTPEPETGAEHDVSAANELGTAPQDPAARVPVRDEMVDAAEELGGTAEQDPAAQPPARDEHVCTARELAASALQISAAGQPMRGMHSELVASALENAASIPADPLAQQVAVPPTSDEATDTTRELAATAPQDPGAHPSSRGEPTVVAQDIAATAAQDPTAQQVTQDEPIDEAHELPSSATQDPAAQQAPHHTPFDAAQEVVASAPEDTATQQPARDELVDAIEETFASAPQDPTAQQIVGDEPVDAVEELGASATPELAAQQLTHNEANDAAGEMFAPCPQDPAVQLQARVEPVDAVDELLGTTAEGPVEQHPASDEPVDVSAQQDPAVQQLVLDEAVDAAHDLFATAPQDPAAQPSTHDDGVNAAQDLLAAATQDPSTQLPPLDEAVDVEQELLITVPQDPAAPAPARDEPDDAATTKTPQEASVGASVVAPIDFGDDDALSEDSLEAEFEKGSRVRIKSNGLQGIITAVTSNGWRRIKLENGGDSDHKADDLEYLDHADALADMTPAEAMSGPAGHVESLQLRDSPRPLANIEIIPGLRVQEIGRQERVGVVTDPVGKGGWARVLWDGFRSSVAARPSSLGHAPPEAADDSDLVEHSQEIVPPGVNNPEENEDATARNVDVADLDESDEHYDEDKEAVQDDAEDMGHPEPVVVRFKATTVKPPQPPQRRRGVIVVGTRVAVYKKNALSKGCGVIIDVRQGGWRRLHLDGEAEPESVSFRMHMLEAIPRHSAIPPLSGPPDNDAMHEVDKDSFQAGCAVVVVRGDNYCQGMHGIIVSVNARNGWRRVALDGVAEEKGFRPWQLELVSAPPASATPGQPGPPAPRAPHSASLEDVIHDLGERVTIIDDDKDEDAIGKVGVVVKVSKKGWRTIRRVDTGELRHYRSKQLHVAAAFEESAAQGSSNKNLLIAEDPIPTPQSPRGVAAAADVQSRVLIIDRSDACFGENGVVVDVRQRGWRKVAMEATGAIRTYRTTQLEDVPLAAGDDDPDHEEDGAVATSEEPNSESVEHLVPEGAEKSTHIAEPESAAPEAATVGTRVRIVVARDSHLGECGIIVDIRDRGWYKVAMEGNNEIRSCRSGQFVIARDADDGEHPVDRESAPPARVMKKSPISQSRPQPSPRRLPSPRSPMVTTGMQVGDRVRIRDEYFFRLGRDVGEDHGLIGEGVVVEIGTAGQHRVVLDSPSDDGTTEVCVPRDRLKILDDNAASLHGPPAKDRPATYRHITRMSYTSSAKRLLSERAAKRSGMQRKICADDEPPTCECISRRAWNMQIAKKLADRRRRQSGATGETLENIEKVGDASDADEKRRAKKRRWNSSAEDAPDDFELIFHDEDEQKFAELEEKQKTIGVECDADCLNRQLCVECVNSSCAHGIRCKNRQFQRGEMRNVVVTKTQQCGWGLVAGEVIRKGEFIIEALGELIDKDEAESRLREAEARGEMNFYMINCDSSGLVIDATRKGNESRFTNHSCDPSCELNKWRVGDSERYGLYAKRDIAIGEEVTFDYRWKQVFWHQTLQERPCYCGAANCNGVFPSSVNASSSSKNQTPGQPGRKRRRGRPRKDETSLNNDNDDERELKQPRVEDDGYSEDGDDDDDDDAPTTTPAQLVEMVRAAKARLLEGGEEADDNAELDAEFTGLENPAGMGGCDEDLLSTRATEYLKSILKESSLLHEESDKDDYVFLEMSNFHKDGPPFLMSTVAFDDGPAEPSEPVGGTHGEAFSLDFDEPPPSIEELREKYVSAAKRSRTTKKIPRVLDMGRTRHALDIRNLVSITNNGRVRKALFEVVESIKPTEDDRMTDADVEEVADAAAFS